MQQTYSNSCTGVRTYRWGEIAEECTGQWTADSYLSYRSYETRVLGVFYESIRRARTVEENQVECRTWGATACDRRGSAAHRRPRNERRTSSRKPFQSAADQRPCLLWSRCDTRLPCASAASLAAQLRQRTSGSRTSIQRSWERCRAVR